MDLTLWLYCLLQDLEEVESGLQELQHGRSLILMVLW
jgi:hypothetical protein